VIARTIETIDQLREAEAKAENYSTTRTGGEYVIVHASIDEWAL